MIFSFFKIPTLLLTEFAAVVHLVEVQFLIMDWRETKESIGRLRGGSRRPIISIEDIKDLEPYERINDKNV